MKKRFPKLTTREFEVTSPFDDGYNCVAFAAEDAELRWWWPSELGDTYWPAEVLREATLEAFVEAFGNLGYEECAGGALETGWQKVAIFVDGRGVPTHMARQLRDGNWASKLGKSEDIRHREVEALEDVPNTRGTYGRVAVYMRRKTAVG